MDVKTDYLKILRALADLPFCVGKKLLIDYLQGNEENESIERNHLSSNLSFGSLAYTEQEIGELVEILLSHELVRYTTVQGKKFWKVLEITPQGRTELLHPTLIIEEQKQVDFASLLQTHVEAVSAQDEGIFRALGKIMEEFTNEQKKAILSNNTQILCIAGAGSGKTTVLTKRIEFLIKYKSVDPARILAITFTRKARAEMMQRLERIPGMSQVQVETFNSFCEQLLKKHNHELYNREVRVITYSEKFGVMNRALASIGMGMERATTIYFTSTQKRLKTKEQLANIFMNDCFFIRDYLKLKSYDVGTLAKTISSAKLVFDICKFIDTYMAEHGLRDFADQLTDTMALFAKRPSLIPRYDHILIDEFQDVNSTQIHLIDRLAAPNIFAVGDPRQSIYGWRGSDIRYLLHFREKYPNSQLLMLTQNYRSSPAIVTLINESIKEMGLLDLKSAVRAEGSSGEVRLVQFDTEALEFEFVIQKIISSNISRKEIFVLARTNKQLVELSALLQARRISHVLRSDELRKTVEAQEQDITLATIHAIKGLEAEMVFVIGCTQNNFPCRGTEHPVVEMVKLEEYDKEEEEKRLFYVAMSRAKKTLYLSYFGSKHTSYITPAMRHFLDTSEQDQFLTKMNLPLPAVRKGTMRLEAFKANPLASASMNSASTGIIAVLKQWRTQKSNVQGVPPYMVLHDATIIDIAQKMPITTQDLNEVHGMGDAKIKRYGREILGIVNGGNGLF